MSKCVCFDMSNVVTELGYILVWIFFRRFFLESNLQEFPPRSHRVCAYLCVHKGGRSEYVKVLVLHGTHFTTALLVQPHIVRHLLFNQNEAAGEIFCDPHLARRTSDVRGEMWSRFVFLFCPLANLELLK